MSESATRPAIWVGHVVLESDRIAESAAFMVAIGMRSIHIGPSMAIFELRGGTHLLIFPKGTVPGGAAIFDLMVEDLVAFRRELAAKGLAAGDIESVPAMHHDRLTVSEPGGNLLTFYSSHVEAREV